MAADRLKDVQDSITRLSIWIDGPSAEQDKLTQLLMRVGKLTEESGEVWDAIIGATGQNPRKGVYKTWGDVDKELLDVIVTAWGALEHRHGNQSVVADMLVQFVAGLLQRAGLSPAGGPVVEEGDWVRVLEWDERDSRHHTAPPPPVIARVRYVGLGNYPNQPTLEIEDGDAGFAARWERVDGRG